MDAQIAHGAPQSCARHPKVLLGIRLILAVRVVVPVVLAAAVRAAVAAQRSLDLSQLALLVQKKSNLFAKRACAVFLRTRVAVHLYFIPHSTYSLIIIVTFHYYFFHRTPLRLGGVATDDVAVAAAAAAAPGRRPTLSVKEFLSVHTIT